MWVFFEDLYVNLKLKNFKCENSVLRFATFRLDFIVLGVLVCYILFGTRAAFAQFGSIESPALMDRSEQEARWDSILHRAHPIIDDEEQTIEELLTTLTEVGLPVRLHQSAEDDACLLDDLVTLEHRSLSLYSRLQSSLEELNATISISRGAIWIVSQSNAWDPELRCSRIYDLSCCTQRPKQFAENVREILYEDVWDGYEAFVKTLPPPKENLMVVNAPYFIQVEVSELLKDINRNEKSPPHSKSPIASSTPIAVEGSFATSLSLSMPIQLPKQNVTSNTQDRGFGGGSFSIPSGHDRVK